MYDKINNEYFEWMCDMVCGERFAKEISYRKLLMYLHSTPFTFVIPRDINRAEDGVHLRYRFALTVGLGNDIFDYIDGPSSILEMMVALAQRCEETIMDDALIGDRTGQWFWNMIKSLGLYTMIDTRFDRDYVNDVLTKFLNRQYSPDGRGGLFTIRGIGCDLREVEIWYQLCWYLDTIT